MIIFSNSIIYLIITFIIFYCLRRNYNNPFIIDVLVAIFWPTLVLILIMYFIFKTIDKLAKK